MRAVTVPHSFLSPQHPEECPIHSRCSANKCKLHKWMKSLCPFLPSDQGSPPHEPLPTCSIPQFQYTCAMASPPCPFPKRPSYTPTHPAIDLPSPPALLSLLVKDLDDVTLLQGQLRSVPGTEVIACFGCAKVFGASCCVGESRGGQWAWSRCLPAIWGQSALWKVTQGWRVPYCFFVQSIRCPVLWGDTIILLESSFQPNQYQI